jgi:hypothetical protein
MGNEEIEKTPDSSYAKKQQSARNCIRYRPPYM